MKLSPTVLVWAEGLKQWIEALQIPDLQQELFPPATQVAAQMPPAGIKTGDGARRRKGIAILKNVKTILAVIALVIATLLLIELKKSKPHSDSVKKVIPAASAAVNQPTIAQATKFPAQTKKDAYQKRNKLAKKPCRNHSFGRNASQYGDPGNFQRSCAFSDLAFQIQ